MHAARIASAVFALGLVAAVRPAPALDFVQPSFCPMAPAVNRIAVELATGGTWEKWPLPRATAELKLDELSSMIVGLEHRMFQDMELPHFGGPTYDYSESNDSFVARMLFKLGLSDEREMPSALLVGFEYVAAGNTFVIPFGAVIGWTMPGATMQLHLGMLTTIAIGGEQTETYDPINSSYVDVYSKWSDLPRLGLEPQVGLQAAVAVVEEWGVYVTAETYAQANVLTLFFDDEPWDAEYLNLEGERSTMQITWGIGPGLALVTPWFDLTTSFDFFPVRIVNDNYRSLEPDFFRFHFSAAGYF